MRRWARSMTSHNQTLRLFWPTKLHNSSSSRISHSRRYSFFDRSRGRGDEAAAAFFLAAWQSSSAPHPSRGRCCAGNALDQQGLYLRVLRRFAQGDRYEPRRVTASITLVAGMTAAVTVAANFRAAAFGAIVNCRDLLYPTKC